LWTGGLVELGDGLGLNEAVLEDGSLDHFG
jgi:hypothetical protein